MSQSVSDTTFQYALFGVAVIILLAAAGFRWYVYHQEAVAVAAVAASPVSSNGQLTDDYSYLALADRRPTTTEKVDPVAAPTRTPTTRSVAETDLLHYVEVTDACPHNYDGECLNVRSRPTTSAPVVHRLRTGVVLKVATFVTDDSGQGWYQVEFDEWLRYPERVNGEWYVAAPYVRDVYDPGPMTLDSDTPATNKRIVVNRGTQTLTAYDGDVVYMEMNISTGLELTPTPRGSFTIFRKTPTRYMQGPLPYMPVQKYYDLPGVPWNLYFTEGGAVIHGAYWHAEFGSQYSHGCVNVDLDLAKQLYDWADLGTTVVVED